MDAMTVNEIFRNPEFLKLATIGGHKVFHLEGDALTHTKLVVHEAFEHFGGDPFMMKVATLHDVGKIYTSIKHGENDWEYPDHAQCGAFRGVLSKFIPEADPDFKDIQWYIRNHIKPLYWRGKDLDAEFAKVMRDAPSPRCTVKNLAGLALCDIRGSVSVEPQIELVEFLENIERHSEK